MKETDTPLTAWSLFDQNHCDEVALVYIKDLERQLAEARKDSERLREACEFALHDTDAMGVDTPAFDDLRQALDTAIER